MIRMSPPRLDHLRRLTDAKGLLHAAIGDCPDRFGGYSVLDNADALRLCAQASGTLRGHLLIPLAKIYFEFLARGRRDDGRVYHACDARGGWSNNGDDALVQSRLAKALASVMVSELPIFIRLRAADWWRELIAYADDARSPRAAGNWLAAIGQLHAADPGRDVGRARMLADWLADSCFLASRRTDWEWFESSWQLGAACIPEGLWYAGQMLDDSHLTDVADRATRFLCVHLFDDEMFLPPGTHGCWLGGDRKDLYDQCPADAAAMVELLYAAERISGQTIFGRKADLAADWFGGANLVGQSLIDPATGGCHDSLTHEGLHINQGGRAVVAYLLTEASRAARAAMRAEPPIFVVPISG